MKARHIRAYAYFSLKGYAIPIFEERKVNRAIMAEEERMLKDRTFRRRPGPNQHEWD